MRKEAQDFLSYIRSAQKHYDEHFEGHHDGWWRFHYAPEAKSFLIEVYESGIWDNDCDSKRDRLTNSDISKLSLADVYSYFTAIIVTERAFNGFYEQMTFDGTMEQLLARYLELTEEGADQ